MVSTWPVTSTIPHAKVSADLNHAVHHRRPRGRRQHDLGGMSIAYAAPLSEMRLRWTIPGYAYKPKVRRQWLLI